MCTFDDCVIGEVYDLCQGNCDGCGSEFGDYQGTYLGMDGDKHKFRAHNCVCSGCGARMRFVYAYCSDGNQINVTEEYNVMFHQKESHWIGGLNTER